MLDLKTSSGSWIIRILPSGCFTLFLCLIPGHATARRYDISSKLLECELRQHDINRITGPPSSAITHKFFSSFFLLLHLNLQCHFFNIANVFLNSSSFHTFFTFSSPWPKFLTRNLFCETTLLLDKVLILVPPPHLPTMLSNTLNDDSHPRFVCGACSSLTKVLLLTFGTAQSTWEATEGSPGGVSIEIASKNFISRSWCFIAPTSSDIIPL